MNNLKVLALICLVAAVNGRSLQATSPPPKSSAPAPKSSPSSAAPAASGTPSAQNILNFALNLEYLEAEFYSCAVTGKGLASSLRGSGAPASTGCQKANLTTVGQQIATELMTNEVNHVKLLRSALGSAAVAAPQLNVGSAFSAVLNAALGSPANPTYSPYTNDVFFLLAAFMFEDVGTTAYEGAIGALANTSYLQTAARIAAVEAYQGGIVRSFMFQANEGTNPNWPYKPSLASVSSSIAALRANASSSQDDVGIVNGTSLTLVPVDSQSLVFTRTPAQVLNIVTLGKGANGGGFFPNGLNGGLTSTSLGGLGSSITNSG